MIVAVCPNPAIDVTYHVPELVHGASHRILDSHARAGGKATNVARVLGQLQAPCTLIAPLAGATGEQFAADARAGGLTLVATPASGPTRRSVAVVDARDATVFNEAGAPLSEQCWEHLLDAVANTLVDGDVLVASGSMPPGVPADAYGALVRTARRAGARTVLDCAGPQLAAALANGPELVKPNAPEAAEFAGHAVATTAQAFAAARRLRELGAGTALISRGALGLVALDDGGGWTASSPTRLAGNPTGAGDALTAALAAGLHAGAEWPELLRDAIATSAAAVVVDVAGAVNLPTREKIRADVIVVRHVPPDDHDETGDIEESAT